MDLEPTIHKEVKETSTDEKLIRSRRVIAVIGCWLLLGPLFGIIYLYRSLNREQWFYRTVITLLFMWCLLPFSLGLIVGIYLIVAFRRRKAEFA